MDSFYIYQYDIGQALQFLDRNKPDSDQQKKIGSVFHEHKIKKGQFERHIQSLALYSSGLPEDPKRFGEFFEGLNDLFKMKLTLEDTSKNPFECFYTPWQKGINVAIKNLSQTIINILKAVDQPVTSFEDLQGLASRNRGNLPITGIGGTCGEEPINTKDLWKLHVLGVNAE